MISAGEEEEDDVSVQFFHFEKGRGEKRREAERREMEGV